MPEITATFSYKRYLSGFWSLLGSYRIIFLVAIFFNVITVLLYISNYLLLRYLVDDVLLQDISQSSLALTAIAFFTLLLMRSIFSFLSKRSATLTGEGILRRLRQQLFDHMQRLPLATHDQFKTGELIQRATSDLETLQRLFTDLFPALGQITFLFIFGTIALVSLNVYLAVLTLLIAPPVAMISNYFSRQVAETYKSYQQQQASMSATLQESLTGVYVIRAFARKNHEIERFNGDSWQLYMEGRRLALRRLWYQWALAISGHVYEVIMLFVGATMTLNGTITVGTFVAYIWLMHFVISPLYSFSDMLVQTAAGVVSLDRVSEIFAAPDEPLDEQDPTSGQLHGAVEFNQVTFQYGESVPVLQDICFACEPGQTVALTGTPGSGKSTVARLLLRFYDVTDGSIRLDGVALEEYPRHTLRTQIGYVDQEPFLFSTSIRDNLTFGIEKALSDSEITAATRIAAIHETILGFPDGYETQVGERGVTLSGGQRQRIALAHTLLKNPRLLILDDATSAVDLETEHHIWTSLQDWLEGRTLIAITTRTDIAMLADQILVFDAGEIVQRGTHHTLMAQPGLYRSMHDLQVNIEKEMEQ